jgi:hypothetical protein
MPSPENGPAAPEPRRRCAWLHHGPGQHQTPEYKSVARGSAPNGEFPSDHPGNVTVTIDNREACVPRPRIGPVPMSPAERQARHRARLSQQGPRPATSPTTRRPPRPARWAAAVAALLELQQDYRAWLDRLPESLEGSGTAEKLQAIAEIDLDELAAIDPPRGYGRD